MYINNQTLIRINRNAEKNGRQTGETDRPKKKELQVQQVRSTGGCQRKKKAVNQGEEEEIWITSEMETKVGRGRRQNDGQHTVCA